MRASILGQLRAIEAILSNALTVFRFGLCYLRNMPSISGMPSPTVT